MNEGCEEPLDRRQVLLRGAALAGVVVAGVACQHAAGLSGPRGHSDGENGYESHTTTPPGGG